MMYVGYEYETALGNTVRKLVTCKTEEEYKKMLYKIEEAGMEPIKFDEVYDSKRITW